MELMMVTEKKPHILESHEIFQKYLMDLGFPRPTYRQYEKACEQWENAERERTKQKQQTKLNGVLSP
jgi:hypothetical protein